MKSKEMKKFEYFVQVLPKDKQKLEELVDHLENIEEPSLKIKKLLDYQDPNTDYFSVVVEGEEASYSMFSSMAQGGDNSLVKSVNKR